MNVFIVYAHPEPRSLNGALKTFMVDHLQRAGHAVEVSDLYAMNWKPQLDAADFPEREPGAHFHPEIESKHAYARGTQTADVAEEQRKLLWADAVILQFPLWWFSMPAILKGWVERVFAYGLAYGVGEHSERRWGDRYGEGALAGRRAMVITTTGGWASHYAPRGINGPMEDLLFPIHHGILYYPGMSVLPPFVVHRTGKVDAAAYAQHTAALGERLDTLATTPPIPYRKQNIGDYDIPAMTLRADLAPGQEGFGVHLDHAREALRAVP
jgi:NAD(P)H dehydrogenase (quinone)